MAKSLAPSRIALVSIGYREFAMPIELAARFLNEAVQIKDGYMDGATVRWVDADPDRLLMNVVLADSIEPAKPLALITKERTDAIKEVSKDCECSERVARDALERAKWSTWNAKKLIENGQLIEEVAKAE